MQVDPIIFYTITAGVIILCIALTIIVYAYTKLAQEVHITKKQNNVPAKDEKQTSQIIEDAEKEAAAIIATARANAITIETTAHLENDKIQKMLDETVQQIVSTHVKALEAMVASLSLAQQKDLETIKKNNIDTFIAISKDIASSAISEMQDFKEILKQETFMSQKEVSKQIQTTYQAMQQELADYRAKQLEKISYDMLQILQQVSQDVLGRTISMADHQELILSALEQAKKEGVLVPHES